MTAATAGAGVRTGDPSDAVERLVRECRIDLTPVSVVATTRV